MSAPVAAFWLATAATKTGTAALAGAGSLTAAATAPIQLARATSQYDSAGVTSNSIILTIPATVQQDDLGFVLVTWPPIMSGRTAVPVTVSATGWTVTVDNSNNSFSPFVILQHAYATADGNAVELDFSQSIPATVVASWYPGIGGIDVVGAVGNRNGTTGQTITAASVPVNGSLGGMLVGFFAERSSTSGTTPTSVSHAVPRVFLEGTGSSIASALIVDSYTALPGSYGDVVATYNTPSGNGSGVLISLMPVGTVPAGRPQFGSTGGLQVVGVARLGNPQFGGGGTFSVTGAVRGQVALGGSGAVSGAGRPLTTGTTQLGGTGRLKTTPTGRPALGSTGTLAVTGRPRVQGGTLLGGQGRLQPVGIGTSAGTLNLGSAGSLALGHPVVVVQATMLSNGRGGLSVTGRPSFPSTVALGGRGGIGSRSSLRVTGHAALGSRGSVTTTPSGLLVRASLALGAGSHLVLDGLADENPSDLVMLGGSGSLQVVGTLGQQAPALFTVKPYYVRKRQDWVVEQERQRHVQALYSMGEPVLFVLMWKVEDYQAGLVTRCPRCAPTADTIQAEIADVYAQPQTTRCPFCYGTTFYGGIRAKIKRPALITDADEDERKGVRGVTHAEQIMVQSTDDFRVRTGDYLFRQDNTRWQLGHPTRIMIRTGYEHPSQAADSIGYNPIPAAREDRSSVAYDIPPNQAELLLILQAPDYPPA